MAEGTTTPRRRKKTEAKGEGADRNTERIVLRRLEIPASIVNTMTKDGDLPPGIRRSDGSIEAWVPVLSEKAEHGPDQSVRVMKGPKKKAVEAYAGKFDDPDARPGDYRAPTLRSWKGGVRIVLPDRPRAEASLFED